MFTAQHKSGLAGRGVGVGAAAGADKTVALIKRNGRRMGLADFEGHAPGAVLRDALEHGDKQTRARTRAARCGCDSEVEDFQFVAGLAREDKAHNAGFARGEPSTGAALNRRGASFAGALVVGARPLRRFRGGGLNREDSVEVMRGESANPH